MASANCVRLSLLANKLNIEKHRAYYSQGKEIKKGNQYDSLFIINNQ
jgi:hypothetical protein